MERMVGAAVVNNEPLGQVEHDLVQVHLKCTWTWIYNRHRLRK